MSRAGVLVVVGILVIALSGPVTATGAGAAAPTEACQRVDLPDPSFRDANCDGIDGQIDAARFVSPAGRDTNPCTRRAPCRTIQRGINRAAALGKRDVYVAGGSYTAFRVASGVNVFGGFGRNFQRRAATATGIRKVTVTGSLALAGAHKVTVLADQVTRRATLADLTLRGADATIPGGSTYVIAGHGSKLTLSRLQIVAGDGSDGTDGASGLDAEALVPPLQSAIDGGDSHEEALDCNDTARGAGGFSGLNGGASPSTRDMTGGLGGSGGTMDTDCFFLTLNTTAAPGDAGSPAGFDPDGPAGDGGSGGGGGDLCEAGGDGQPGAVANGSAGQAAPSGRGRVTGGFWRPLPGTAGGTGENGSGGGGGGGSGGCDQGTDSWGAGGGGGGAGGLAAQSGGTAGSGGGGSFGVFLVDSTVNLSKTTITRGSGGAGGAGGAGGRGQPGGAGGEGGAGIGTGAGGDGGDGAHGGHGGGGAGGAGGASIAILKLRATVAIGAGVQLLGGSAGAGGAGGISAPGATATPDDDGNDGPPGPAGLLGGVTTCGANAAC